VWGRRRRNKNYYYYYFFRTAHIFNNLIFWKNVNKNKWK
jgi:hypothetical protein